MAQIIVRNLEDAVVERLKTRVALAEALECRVVTADRKFFQALLNGPQGSNLSWVGDLEGD